MIEMGAGWHRIYPLHGRSSRHGQSLMINRTAIEPSPTADAYGLVGVDHRPDSAIFAGMM
jgi:hypothetical protein